jgi:hypothetical protein
MSLPGSARTGSFVAGLRRRFPLLALLTLGVSVLCAQDAAVPRDLDKTFERYAKAWIQRDWGRIYDLTSAGIRKTYDTDFGSRQNWINHQEKDFQDKVTTLEYIGSYQITNTIFTFEIVTKGKRPNGEPFTVKGYASFELIERQWYLVDPIFPPNSQQPAQQPSTQSGTSTGAPKKKLKGFWED